MRRFKSILFLADGSEGERSVLARAVELARANGAKITLFDALDAESCRFDDPETGSAVEAMNRAHFEERREELEDLCRLATSRHPELNTAVEVETGGAARGVIRSVLINRHDLVMKAAEGRHGLFGSTDQKLMRKCPCPVWIVKPSPERYFRRVLAAVDLNPKRSRWPGRSWGSPLHWRRKRGVSYTSSTSGGSQARLPCEGGRSTPRRWIELWEAWRPPINTSWTASSSLTNTTKERFTSSRVRPETSSRPSPRRSMQTSWSSARSDGRESQGSSSVTRPKGF